MSRISRLILAFVGLLCSVVVLPIAGHGQETGVPAGGGPANPDSIILRLARAALDEGRYWRATELLAPVVDVESRRTPEAVLLAARAAGGWHGWTHLQGILASQVWSDSASEGEAHALLAQAYLNTGNDTLAAYFARSALIRAISREDSSTRLVTLASALGRIGDASGAAQAYMSAAALNPVVGDWLRLRAAEWMADSAARAQALATVTLPHAASRAELADVRARENTGDTTGAIAGHMRMGGVAAALSLRRAVAATPEDTASLRADALAALAGVRGATVRSIVDVLDSVSSVLSPAEHLFVARALGSMGGERTVRSFETALNAGMGSSADRFLYGTMLQRLGRNEQAIAQFASVKEPAALAAAAAYQRARTMLRTAAPEDWRAALRAVVRDYPEDSSSATALFLLADLATDEGRDSDARDAFLASARRFPSGPRAPASLFNAAMIAYVQGDFSTAAEEFAALRSGFPQSSEVTAATYWRGRSLASLGDTTAIAASCGRIRTADSLSYYAGLCAERGHLAFRLTAPAKADSFVVVPGLDSAAQRIVELRRLGLEDELVLELERIRAVAGPDAEATLAAANLARELGYGARAISLAQLAQSRGASRDARLFRLLYPNAYSGLVGAEAEPHGMDADLLAGLIRQESLFNPAATSPAGARGLMQIMPAVGSTLARELAFPVWDPALLWQPDVSARLGVQHFADLLGTQQHPFHVLAAYNAGANRVERWLTKQGMADPEVFVERIPFVETRDYVRIVWRNRAIYQALYRR
jgi:soluble lytic murein transglycosylase